jgi:hypothetical protein
MQTLAMMWNHIKAWRATALRCVLATGLAAALLITGCTAPKSKLKGKLKAGPCGQWSVEAEWEIPFGE